MSSLLSNEITPRLLRDLVSPEFRSGLMNAPVNKRGPIGFGDKELDKFTLADLAEVQTMRVGDFFRGLRGSVLAGTFATEDDLYHVPSDFFGDIAYTTGHFLGFMADMGAIKFLGNTVAKGLGGLKKTPTWNNYATTYWNNHPDQRKQMIDGGIIKLKHMGMIKPKGSGKDFNILKTTDKEWDHVLKQNAKDGVIQLPKSYSRGPLEKEIQKLLPNEVSLVGGDVIHAFTFGTQLGVHDTLGTAIRTKKFGVPDKFGNIVLGPDDIDWSQAVKAGFLGEQILAPTEDFNLLHVPFLRGMTSGVAISAGANLIRTSLKPMFTGPERHLVRDAIGEAAVFGAIESMDYIG